MPDDTPVPPEWTTGMASANTLPAAADCSTGSTTSEMPSTSATPPFAGLPALTPQPRLLTSSPRSQKTAVIKAGRHEQRPWRQVFRDAGTAVLAALHRGRPPQPPPLPVAVPTTTSRASSSTSSRRRGTTAAMVGSARRRLQRQFRHVIKKSTKFSYATAKSTTRPSISVMSVYHNKGPKSLLLSSSSSSTTTRPPPPIGAPPPLTRLLPVAVVGPAAAVTGTAHNTNLSPALALVRSFVRTPPSSAAAVTTRTTRHTTAAAAATTATPLSDVGVEPSTAAVVGEDGWTLEYSKKDFSCYTSTQDDEEADAEDDDENSDYVFAKPSNSFAANERNGDIDADDDDTIGVRCTRIQLWTLTAPTTRAPAPLVADRVMMKTTTEEERTDQNLTAAVVGAPAGWDMIQEQNIQRVVLVLPFVIPTTATTTAAAPVSEHETDDERQIREWTIWLTHLMDSSCIKRLPLTLVLLLRSDNADSTCDDNDDNDSNNNNGDDGVLHHGRGSSSHDLLHWGARLDRLCANIGIEQWYTIDDPRSSLSSGSDNNNNNNSTTGTVLEVTRVDALFRSVVLLHIGDEANGDQSKVVGTTENIVM